MKPLSAASPFRWARPCCSWPRALSGSARTTTCDADASTSDCKMDTKGCATQGLPLRVAKAGAFPSASDRMARRSGTSRTRPSITSFSSRFRAGRASIAAAAPTLPFGCGTSIRPTAPRSARRAPVQRRGFRRGYLDVPRHDVAMRRADLVARADDDHLRGEERRNSRRRRGG